MDPEKELELRKEITKLAEFKEKGNKFYTPKKSEGSIYKKSKYKNPLGSIMHFLDDDGRYLCNKACGVTKEKSTKIVSEVTCLNCRRSLRC